MDANWNLIGHEWAVRLLKTQIGSGQLRQAYLLTGPPGIGRRTLALRAAQALNCQAPPAPGEFCGECRACRGFARSQHPDLLLVSRNEGDRDLRIEAIRELRRELSRTPLEANSQVAILINFEDASVQAANALLKTLEEPNPRTLICLTATDEDRLPPTIVSRCELLRLRPVPAEMLSASLVARGLDAEQAQLLARLSAGRPGLALRWQAQPELLQRRADWLDACDSLLTANPVQRFAFAEKASKDRHNLRELLLVWLSFWRDALLRAGGSSAAVANPDREAQLEQVAQTLNLDSIHVWVEKLQETLDQLETNVNARLALEALLLHLPG
ncbi:MAG: DNA polymerase III subunit [Anaerolineales bacterium]|nr:DNA polymerase III subunit [Anaerolineales bacterium]MCW5855266.1 DNA polymerase III subunit [Anaerolineales bacterium]